MFRAKEEISRTREGRKEDEASSQLALPLKKKITGACYGGEEGLVVPEN